MLSDTWGERGNQLVPVHELCKAQGTLTERGWPALALVEPRPVLSIEI